MHDSDPLDRDYSQRGEQRAVLAALAGRAPGRFLDVGAWDGETFSNTRALALRGWGGVLVEPSPGPASKLLALYGGEPRRHTVVCAAIADESGPEFMAVSEDGLSTFDGEHAVKWSGVAAYRRAVVCRITWRELIRLVGSNFDAVSIDAEGMSAAILRAMPAEIRPTVLVVEKDGDPSAQRIELAARGMSIAEETPENLVAVRGEP